MIQEAVQKIEENILKSKKFVELDKALERLEYNKDFQMVITEGYLQHEAVRLVHLKADPAMQTTERQASVINQIDAIGGLLQYFRTVSHNANVAMKTIESDEAAVAELLEEDAQRG